MNREQTSGNTGVIFTCHGAVSTQNTTVQLKLGNRNAIDTDVQLSRRNSPSQLTNHQASNGRFLSRCPDNGYLTPLTERQCMCVCLCLFIHIEQKQHITVLSSKVPTYLADDIHLASESSARCLMSSSGRKCSVIGVHSRFGDICFTAAGPRIWNNLPASLRDKEVSCTEFRDN